MAKRKENTLYAFWSKREKDVMICFPSKPSGHLLHQFLSNKALLVLPKTSGADMKKLYEVKENPYMAVFEDKSFLQELEHRGYDLTTLRFSIDKKEKIDKK
jgi:hypothetical protein